MVIIHNFTMALDRRGVTPVVDAVQGDSLTRKLAVTLTENGSEAWPVPTGVTAGVAFRKPDGHKGLYDTLPDGGNAVTVSANMVTAVLAPEVLSCAGETWAAIVLHDENLKQLATFPVCIRVAPNPAAGVKTSNDYYNYSTMEEVNAAIDEAFSAIREAEENCAPAIVCEKTGSNISLNDSANRLLKGLNLYGKTTQNGTPTPDAPAELLTAGADGIIVVNVTGETGDNVQTITASTPTGLPGIPVTSGGNYTDENGQQWICDEIDFARGVYVKRCAKANLGTLSWKVASNADVFFTGDLQAYIKVAAVMCDRYVYKGTTTSNQNAYGKGNFSISILSSDKRVYLRDDSFGMDATALKSALTGVMLLYARATPTETALTAEELAAYAAMHTNKSNTTVYNDAGAGMTLQYVADTKSYIDNKFAELANAIVNNA